jgi:hypothetical protein
MASSFSRLSALVAADSLRIIELQAVPRSLSTALGRCLNESGATSVLVNEPFNTPPHDVDTAAGHILGWVQPAMSSAHGPVIVVSKNMARFLSASVLRTWTDVCAAVVWCVRDPRLQISSLVTRTANDLLFGVGADRLNHDDLSPSHLAMVTEFLQNSAWSTDFSKTGWRAIGEHFDDCAGRLPGFVADGSLFSRVPDRFLRYLCAGLGIEFREQMIHGWTEPFLNVDGIDNPVLADTAADAWIKHAATSCGVEPARQEALDASVLPAALREHLLEVALPAYEMFMRAFASQDNLVPYRLAVGDHP